MKHMELNRDMSESEKIAIKIKHISADSIQLCVPDKKHSA